MKLAFIVALLLATSPVAAQIATTTSAATSSASSGTGAEEICDQCQERSVNPGTLNWDQASEDYSKYRPGYPDSYFLLLQELGIGKKIKIFWT